MVDLAANGFDVLMLVLGAHHFGRFQVALNLGLIRLRPRQLLLPLHHRNLIGISTLRSVFCAASGESLVAGDVFEEVALQTLDSPLIFNCLPLEVLNFLLGVYDFLVFLVEQHLQLLNFLSLFLNLPILV